MQNIRNFVIIAHIDHGKSTLADRFLELTGTVEKRKMQEQYLDTMELERERGITIKLQPVRMQYALGSTLYVLNLIDTPGHVDFSYEVSRSLAAVEGAILLVDATQGVQAQTLANLHLAQAQNLVIIPVINKIDLPNARVAEVEEEMRSLGVGGEVLKISAKNGTGVAAVLEKIIENVPPPANQGSTLKALIFDSAFDTYKGVLAYVRVFGGNVKAGDQLKLFASKADVDVIEVGTFAPALTKTKTLLAGEIGYIATGLKDVGKVRVGDTLMSTSDVDMPLSGYKEPRPVVFASFYPARPTERRQSFGREDGDQYDELRDALGKLKLTDASLTYEPESSPALGRGFRLGFLGMLHVEIISERLRREFKLSLIISTPSVAYHFLGDVIEEPMVTLEILTPVHYLGPVMKLLADVRSVYQTTTHITKELVILKYQVPLAEIITDFYDKLKSVSSGYASMSYEPAGYQVSDLVRLDILVAGDLVEPFSRIVPRERAYHEGKRIVEKLKVVIPRQWFMVTLQAAIGGPDTPVGAGKIIARESLSALRKDVTGYLYGGDITRKKKLLEKQKRGKKKMQERGKVEIPQGVFLEMLKK